jgi:sulfite exporter TauE/SafE
MTPEAISAALLAGIVTSLHCAGMCGPLACAACTGDCGRTSQQAAMIYHSSRLLSYALVGGIVGAIGSRISEVLTGGATRGITWVFVLFFLAVVFGLDKKLRVPGGAGRISHALTRTWDPRLRGAGLGFLTPLLPCAPLYLMVAAAGFSGSALQGGVVMLAFGAGTVPLLFLIQNRLAWLQARWSPQRMDYLRRGLALASVVLLLVRGTFTASTGCPMCH